MNEIFEISFTYEVVGKTKVKADNASEAFWKLTNELKENGLDKIEYKTVDTNFSIGAAPGNGGTNEGKR